MKLFLIFTIVGAAWCMPRDIEQTTQRIVPVPNQGRAVNGQRPAVNTLSPPPKQDTVVQFTNVQRTAVPTNVQGQVASNQFGFFQSVRKQWKCQNGECEEKIVNCKNGNCDSLENRFKATDYQPEVPQLDPIPFPANYNFAAIFNSNHFPKLEFPPLPQFDNTGEVDLVLNNNNQQYYFSNARFVKSKCINGVCEIKTKTCTNGKCDETVATQKL